MSKAKANNRRRKGDRRISVRAVRRSHVDSRPLSRALLQSALAAAAAEAAAQAETETKPREQNR